jgi:CheY-like chemotaxis protein
MLQSENRRILVVDDEPCIADTLATILRSSGYDAVSFHNGKSALEASRFHAPDLLITDVTMPGMSGLELAILMRKLCPDCRILLFSGLSHNFDLVEEANRKGHNFVLLEKPIHPAELLKKVAATVTGDSPLQPTQRPA